MSWKRPVLLLALLPSSCAFEEAAPPVDEVETPAPSPLLAACGAEFSSCRAPDLWPGGEIRYELAGAWSQGQRDELTAAMNDWSSRTGGFIRFVADEAAANRVQFDGGGCQSALGMTGGIQVTRLRECSPWSKRHELGHLIGLAHQHQRTDRNRYVRFKEAIYCTPPRPLTASYCGTPADFCGYGSHASYTQALISDNIRKCQGGDGSDYGAYDRASVMHYQSDFPGDCGSNIASCGLLAPSSVRISNPAAVTAGDASAVFELYRARQGWTPFRQVYRADPGASSPLDIRPTSTVTMAGSPALARWGSDGVVALMRGSNNHIYVKFRTGSSWPTGSWTDIGGDFNSDPAAVSWGPGRLDVVAVGTNGNLFHKWHSNGWAPSWGSLGRPGAAAISAPAIASWGPDRLDIFVRSGQDLYQKSWTSAGWTGWSAVPAGCCIQGKPAAVSWGPDRIDVVAVGSGDGQTWFKPFENGVWHPWALLGGQARSGTSPAIASGAVDRLNVYITGDNGRLWHNGWDGDGWSGFVDIGGIPIGSPSAATSPGGRAHVIIGMSNGSFTGVWHRFWE